MVDWSEFWSAFTETSPTKTPHPKGLNKSKFTLSLPPAVLLFLFPISVFKSLGVVWIVCFNGRSNIRLQIFRRQCCYFMVVQDRLVLGNVLHHFRLHSLRWNRQLVLIASTVAAVVPIKLYHVFDSSHGYHSYLREHTKRNLLFETRICRLTDLKSNWM